MIRQNEKERLRNMGVDLHYMIIWYESLSKEHAEQYEIYSAIIRNMSYVFFFSCSTLQSSWWR